ncbi:MAG: hypothetical protein ACI8Z1_000265 [Candidatus Azotimanducaceae bacterium]|jgi:hypothetical protein
MPYAFSYFFKDSVMLTTDITGLSPREASMQLNAMSWLMTTLGSTAREHYKREL